MRTLPIATSLAVAAVTAHAAPITLTVGPGGFATLHDAVATETAGNTYTINITAGTYVNDFSVVSIPTTIQAVGGPVILQATVAPTNLKGIITTTADLTVIGITFTGAAISDADGGNAAGIRDQSTTATTLRVENSSFIGNQNGILTSSGGTLNLETVQIINSIFLDNGSGSGFTHALYVGDALSLLVQNSFFCGTNAGHNVKSRAASTTITGTTSFDGTTGAGCNDAGSASYGFEFPNGGVVNLIDDNLFQGNTTDNFAMIGYGAEGYPYGNNTLELLNTALTSTRDGIGINHFGATGTCTLQSSPISGPLGFVPVNPPEFCTTVTGPTPVPEPSTGGLLLTASLGWAVTFLGRWRRE
jgi:hypothetical protein